MRPLSFFLGILLGTTVAITFVLLVVDLIYFLLGNEYPRLKADFAALGAATALFMVLTTLAALSFYGQLRQRAWWPVAGAVTVLWLGVVGIYFKP